MVQDHRRVEEVQDLPGQAVDGRDPQGLVEEVKDPRDQVVGGRDLQGHQDQMVDGLRSPKELSLSRYE